MPKMLRTSDEVYAMRELLRGSGVRYTFEKSGNSIMLIYNGNVKHYASTIKDAKDRMPIGEINFIAKVKKHIESQGLDESIGKIYRSDTEIKFVRGGGMVPGEVLEECYMVDIGHAYWMCAYKLGYITKALYKEGLQVDKKVRLAALGTFAKKIHRVEFDGRREGRKVTINPKSPQVFFNCAKMVDIVMDNCAEIAGKDFILYWTDCVYVKSKVVLKEMKAYLSAEGFKSKAEHAARVERLPEYFHVYKRKRDIEPKKYPLKMEY